MKYSKILVGLSLCMMAFTSCRDLDMPPKNIITGTDVYNEAGMEAYMAALYGRLPMEDFNACGDGNSKQGYFWWYCAVNDMHVTGEAMNMNTIGGQFGALQRGYWSNGYQLIRNINVLIQDLPAYIGQINGAEEWLAEARFLRAYTYFAMVHRYGGVPILAEPQPNDATEEELWVPRSSHEASIDFILEDLNYAMANMTPRKVNGRANRYVAAAFKSRVALYAASVARYGQEYNHKGRSKVDTEDVLLCGIPEERAVDYYKQAFDAALVCEEGDYSLYQNEGVTAANFQNIFLNADNSSESIFIRQYDLNNNVHSWDAVNCPDRMTTTYSGRFNPTLDWAELFDGLPLDPETGRLKTVDDEGNYLVYNDEKELWANVEPRLRGSVMIPGDTYKGITVDIRAGIIKENVDPSTKIAKFVPDDGETTLGWKTASSWFASNIVTNTQKLTAQTPYTTSTGVKLNINGLEGPVNGGSYATYSGFHGLKYIDTRKSVAATTLHTSTQSWIDIRYAEVLLNRAEAAVELAQSGVPSYHKKQMLDDAFWCVNLIRQRGGAKLLSSSSQLSSTPRENARGTGINSFVFAPNEGLHIIRVERFKELAFERKIYWDLRRWFTYHEQIKDYRRRMFAPFLFAKDATLDKTTGNPVGKYIYDVRVCERGSDRLTFTTKFYYDPIPNSERINNPLLIQNNQY